jgi:heme oxygenase
VKSAESARHALRIATAADHDRVDAAFAGFDLADRQGYRDFLSAQAAALIPVEVAIDAAGGAALVADWPSRKRSQTLKADLEDLGVDAPDGGPVPKFVTQAETLGAIYVLEGSRLGGGVLARSVPAHFPSRFLSTPDATRWRTLIEILDDRLTTPQARDEAINSARRTFALFEVGANRYAKVR